MVVWRPAQGDCALKFAHFSEERTLDCMELSLMVVPVTHGHHNKTIGREGLKASQMFLARTGSTVEGLDRPTRRLTRIPPRRPKFGSCGQQARMRTVRGILAYCEDESGDCVASVNRSQARSCQESLIAIGFCCDERGRAREVQGVLKAISPTGRVTRIPPRGPRWLLRPGRTVLSRKIPRRNSGIPVRNSSIFLVISNYGW
jgi:hypothetical protein